MHNIKRHVLSLAYSAFVPLSTIRSGTDVVGDGLSAHRYRYFQFYGIFNSELFLKGVPRAEKSNSLQTRLCRMSFCKWFLL